MHDKLRYRLLNEVLRVGDNVTLRRGISSLYGGDHGKVLNGIDVCEGIYAVEFRILGEKIVVGISRGDLYKYHLSLQELMVRELDLSLSDFDHWATDLYVLYTSETDSWLRENYRWYNNVKGFRSDVEGQLWYGKSCLEIPFAYTELREDMNPYILYEVDKEGWSYDTLERPGDSRTFNKGDTHIWSCKHNDTIMWCRAYNKNGRYINHRYHYGLLDAIYGREGIE